MISKRRFFGISVLHFAAFACVLGATEHRTSLVVVEFGADSHGVARTQTLVRFHFRNGVLTGKENLLTTSEIRFDLGESQIVDNRYVITNWGDAIDLTTGKAALKSRGELVGIDKQSNAAIIRVDRTDETGTYSFGLDTKHYEPLKVPGNWTASGIRSPDGKLVAEGNFTAISLHRPDGKNLLLGNGFVREGTVRCNSFASPTFVWLDDTHLLTQRGNGNLVVVDDKGNIEPLLLIPDVQPLACGPELRRDDGGQIYYAERNGDWLIDVNKHRYEKLIWESEGNGFEMEHERNTAMGQSIRYRAAEIGKWPCDIFQVSTAPGQIAVEYGRVGSHLGGVSEGVRVWSADNREWTTIGPAWIAAIVGWVDE
jgi:hypothetical protein